MLFAGVSLFFGCNTEDSPDNSETNNTVIGKPASLEPFNRNYCGKTADELVFSDGEWTIDDMFSLVGIPCKITVNASAKNNEYTLNSGILTIDYQDEDSGNRPSSDEECKAMFNELKNFFFTDLSESLSYSSSYATSGGTVVMTADIDSKVLPSLFSVSKVDGKVIKTNAKNTKYVIQYSETETIYIYRNANLNDAEEISTEIPPEENVTLPEEISTDDCTVNIENLADFTFPDGNWNVIIDEETMLFTHLGTDKSVLKGECTGGEFTFTEGSEYVYVPVSSYDTYETLEDKIGMFESNVGFFYFYEKTLVHNDNLIAILGDCTKNTLDSFANFMAFSIDENTTVKTNADQSKFVLKADSYTVYMQKISDGQ